MRRPRIGITVDAEPTRFTVGRGYSRHVLAAGGLPVLLPPVPDHVCDLLAMIDGVVFTGGDDPRMEDWGVPTHPAATPIDAERQAFERGLLAAIGDRPAMPVLGVCLGMQLMGLEAGGMLDQHLPDTLASADEHWGKLEHAVEGALGSGIVCSHHRQAITDPGRLDVAATAPDGVIEAIRDPRRAFYVGVQWHPERTDDPRLGRSLFEELVAAARR
ncbi:MAG: gamma-glutamyl-gamma-aminobutyrate hydrolase family protein [Planctomycetota bacterium]|jgi:putative glutamine amidotransferase